jgi:pilus assembly protein CpaF
MTSHHIPTDMGLGPLEDLLGDPDITAIMVNGTRGVYIEKHGQLSQVDIHFPTEDHVINLINRILEALKLEMDERYPLLDERLPDGSRINVSLRPVAITGPSLTLRKTLQHRLTWPELLAYGSVSEKIVQFLEACVRANLNMVIAGGTNSGKTTIINALSEFIPPDQRIITVEQTATLNLRHPHVVSLEARPASPSGHAVIGLRDLIHHAQKMRPSRIISSDVMGQEAWDMLHVMSMGYEGSMFTMHATSPEDVLSRLELMATASTNLPLLQIRAMIAQSLHVIIQQLQIGDGTRKIVAITEVTGLKNNLIEMRDIFRWQVATNATPDTRDEKGRIPGNFISTGYRPSFAHRLHLPDDFFSGI